MTPQCSISAMTTTVIITGRVHPHVCGVGDYSINLANYFKTEFNLKVNIIAGQGCQALSEPVSIFPYVENWSKQGLQKLLNFLETEKVETVILQYTPWLYSHKGFNLELIQFWKECAKKFKTLLIAHETYSWFLKYPGTWVVGLLQQYVLQNLVRSSHQVFSGSELYLHRLRRFSKHPEKIHYLPIPNNISPKIASTDQKQELRQKLGITAEQIVLTLFGCGGSIWQHWISRLDSFLIEQKHPIVWLLLGDAQSLSLSFQTLVVRPGYLTPVELSYYLQIADLMLMPHEFGVSAKRGSLVSALNHSLPIVGTDGLLTDSFLRQLPSIFLVPDGHYLDFEKQVLNTLSKLPTLHHSAQASQDYYHQHLSWPIVTQTLLPYL